MSNVHIKLEDSGKKVNTFYLIQVIVYLNFIIEVKWKGTE